jgi:hypothetical protein
MTISFGLPCPARNRRQRYEHFQAFASEAEGLFGELFELANIPCSQYAVSAGGFKGGQDKRLVEIAFTNIIYDKIKLEDSALAISAIAKENAILIEVGPSMTYQRRDNGDVVCILYPSRTYESREQEDLIILDYIRQPCHLWMLYVDHWHDLLAYRACTTIDGMPSLWQRLRCAYLRHFKKRGVDLLCRPAKAPSWLKQLVVFTIGAAAGGLITNAVERKFFPEEKTPSSETSLSMPSSVLAGCKHMEEICSTESTLRASR